MKNEQLIENLILQDMRHMQLIYGLEALGLEEEGFHCLNISVIVAELMGIADNELIDMFISVYWRTIKKCNELEMEFLGENLRPLARGVFRELVELINDLPELKL